MALVMQPSVEPEGLRPEAGWLGTEENVAHWSREPSGPRRPARLTHAQSDRRPGCVCACVCVCAQSWA